MKTLLTIKQQQDFLDQNWQYKTLKHKWSSRGMGNSKIIDNQGNIIAKAGGCGYDRYGAALGKAIIKIFPNEIYKLAKRECKGSRRNYKQSEKFYGLFYNAIEDRAWIDGACGSSCMRTILNKIGFSLQYVGESENSSSGEQFYILHPISKHDRRFI